MRIVPYRDDVIKIGDEAVVCSNKTYDKKYGTSSELRQLGSSETTVTIKINKTKSKTEKSYIEYSRGYFWVNLFYDRNIYKDIQDKIEKRIEIGSLHINLGDSENRIGDSLTLKEEQRDNRIEITDSTIIFMNFFKKDEDLN
jgi:hypothetical protein